jgi:hypothetical protein
MTAPLMVMELTSRGAIPLVSPVLLDRLSAVGRRPTVRSFSLLCSHHAFLKESYVREVPSITENYRQSTSNNYTHEHTKDKRP